MKPLTYLQWDISRFSFCCRLSLTIIVFVAGLDAKPAETSFENMGSNCFIDYLRSIDELGDSFPKHDEALNFKTNECDALVETARVKAYEGAAYTVTNNPAFYKHTDCIMKKLKANKWYEQILKKIVLDGTENMPVEELNQKISEVNVLTNSIFMGSIVDCMNEKEFGKKFNHYFKTDDSSSEEEEDHITDYCGKKYVVDKHLIDNSNNTVELNPSKIDVSNVDCDVILGKFEKEFYEKLEKKLRKPDDDKNLTDEKVTCAATKYREGDLFHKILTLKTLNDLKITDEQKEIERKGFMEFMTKLTATLISCQDEPFDKVTFTKRIAHL